MVEPERKQLPQNILRKALPMASVVDDRPSKYERTEGVSLHTAASRLAIRGNRRIRASGRTLRGNAATHLKVGFSTSFAGVPLRFRRWASSASDASGSGAAGARTTFRR